MEATIPGSGGTGGIIGTEPAAASSAWKNLLFFDAAEVDVVGRPLVVVVVVVVLLLLVDVVGRVGDERRVGETLTADLAFVLLVMLMLNRGCELRRGGAAAPAVGDDEEEWCCAPAEAAATSSEVKTLGGWLLRNGGGGGGGGALGDEAEWRGLGVGDGVVWSLRAPTALEGVRGGVASWK